ncbi:MAG TPA: hypothetical protein VD815_09755 [Candidatus Saccharimonadales bacterium]|nr:hypothetical protein [Candidatus Saccharimonadales bacterium]
MTESVYEWKNDESITENTIKNDNMILEDDPLASFLYALKSSEAKRQYSARLMKFFDYLELDNSPLDSKYSENYSLRLLSNPDYSDK